MNKVLALLCLALLVCGACKRETKHEKFHQDFLQFTQKECPKQIDPYTRLDSVVYNIEMRTLTEYYTVSDKLDDDSIYANGQIMSNFRETMLKGLKGSIQLKQYKDEGITFRYEYRSITTGEVKLELSFTKEDYEN